MSCRIEDNQAIGVDFGRASTLLKSALNHLRESRSMESKQNELPCQRDGEGGLKILIADDTPLVIAPIIKLLERCGHRVTEVRNGREAVSAYLADPPDMILMDVMMPGMDGIEATRHIKRLSAERWVPLMMMTSLDAKSDLVRGFEAGADDYMIKPIDMDVLYARIRAMHRIAAIQDQLHRIIDNVYEGIITIDERGIVKSFNPAAEQMFGYHAVEVVGSNVSMLMPSPDREAHDGYIARYVAGGAARIIGQGRKVTALHKSGLTFPMQLFVTEVRHQSGRQFIGLVRDITHEEAERERLDHLARYDQLTELPNRASFSQALQTACNRAMSQPSAVLFLDLDGFKPINDTYGHEVGDAALFTLARRLRHSVAEADFVARLGGDEFVIILQDVGDSANAGAVAGRIIDVINQPMDLLDHPCRLGVSIGIALIPTHGQVPDAVLSRADDAMYAAKAAGKNRYVLASDKA